MARHRTPRNVVCQSRDGRRPSLAIEFHLFPDRGMLDVGTCVGRVFESRVHHAVLEDLGVEISTEGGTVTLLSLDAW
jgi:hypothetical protein